MQMGTGLHRVMSTDAGWVYCMTNPAMPGIVKIGESGIRDLNQRKNKLFTTGVPMPFDIAFAIYVARRKEKESLLHLYLSDKRVWPGREFFEITPEHLKVLFNLMEGTWWSTELTEPLAQSIESTEPTESTESTESSPLTESTESTPLIEPTVLVQSTKKWQRPGLNEFLSDGQKVCHLASCNTEWVGTYSRVNNAIMYNGIGYTLNQFARAHYEEERPDRKPGCNAWKECKVLKDSSWISIHSFSK